MTEAVVVSGCIIIFFTCMALALIWQKKALVTQNKAAKQYEESIAVQNKAVKQVDESIAMQKRSVENQEIMIQLLQQLVEQTKK